MATRLVVLISGNGSNLQAIIDAIASGVLYDTAIALVIANRKDAYGLQRARNADIETVYHNLLPYRKKYSNSGTQCEKRAREVYDADLAEIVLRAKPTMVVCAGWMHILTNTFLDALEQAKVQIINLHPALPQEYNGAMAIERAYEDFVEARTTRTGVMVHYVIQDVDQGTPIITQEVVMKSGDQLEDLKERIHAVEHELIVKGIQIALERRLAAQ